MREAGFPFGGRPSFYACMPVFAVNSGTGLWYRFGLQHSCWHCLHLLVDCGIRGIGVDPSREKSIIRSPSLEAVWCAAKKHTLMNRRSNKLKLDFPSDEDFDFHQRSFLCIQIKKIL